MESKSLSEAVCLALGSSPEAESLSRDPGLFARQISLGARGAGCWAGSAIDRDPARADAFRRYVEAAVQPGRERLIRIGEVYSNTATRTVAAVTLRHGIRLSSPAGKKLQLSAGTAGLLAVGRPDPQEDVVDVAMGLGRGSCLLLLPPHRGSGLLLAARATAGSTWWPLAPRTGPRPKRTKNQPAL